MVKKDYERDFDVIEEKILYGNVISISYWFFILMYKLYTLVQLSSKEMM